ncbi:MAG: cytochrome c oxidase subunit II [Alphaproteobacteria bacterium]
MSRRGATRLAPAVLLLVLSLALGSCEGVQSALAPSAPEAARIAQLSWVLFAGAAVIFVAVTAVALLALFGPERWRRRIAGESTVIAGGLVFPTVVVTAVLVYSLVLTSADPLPVGDGEPVRVTVVGERWWWRVIYTDARGRSFESANELRLPLGQPVEIALLSNDVIHSFWVPKLAGKLDMVPGRVNRMRVMAQETGVSRGQCAEYCGGPHALMAFYVRVMEPPAFEAWVAEAAGPARPPPHDPIAERGRALFLANGCGACHTVRGTPAAGTIGPDLTHVGGRLSLAAGILPNTAEAMAAWIVGTQRIKPENLMPPFEIFDPDELAALAGYLASLK